MLSHYFLVPAGKGSQFTGRNLPTGTTASLSSPVTALLLYLTNADIDTY